MANPYSQPSQFTYTPLPLEKFAELAKIKQNEYDATVSAADKLKSDALFRSGLLTAGKEVEQKKYFDTNINAAVDELMTTGNSRAVARKIMDLQSWYNNDPEVQAAKADYEMTPKITQAIMENPGAFFGFLDDQGNPIPLNGPISTQDIYKTYSNFAAAPTYKPEKEFYDSIPEEYKEDFQNFKVHRDPNSGLQYYTYGKTQKISKSITDIVQNTNKQYYEHLKTLYNNAQGSSAYFKKKYGDQGGFEKYVESVVNYLRPLEGEKVTEDRNLGLVPGQGDGSGSGSGVDDLAVGPKYIIDEGGVIQATDLKAKPFEIRQNLKHLNQQYDKLISEGKIDEANALASSPQYQVAKASQDILDFKQNESQFTKKLEEKFGNDYYIYSSPDIEELKNLKLVVEDWEGAETGTIDFKDSKGIPYKLTEKAAKRQKEVLEGIRSLEKELEEFVGQDLVKDNKLVSIGNLSPEQQTTFKEGVVGVLNPEYITTGAVELLEQAGDNRVLREWDTRKGAVHQRTLINELRSKISTGDLEMNDIRLETGDRGSALVLTVRGTISEDGVFTKETSNNPGQAYTIKLPFNNEKSREALNQMGTEAQSSLAALYDSFNYQQEGKGGKEARFEKIAPNSGLAIGDRSAWIDAAETVPLITSSARSTKSPQMYVKVLERSTQELMGLATDFASRYGQELFTEALKFSMNDGTVKDAPLENAVMGISENFLPQVSTAGHYYNLNVANSKDYVESDPSALRPLTAEHALKSMINSDNDFENSGAYNFLLSVLRTSLEAKKDGSNDAVIEAQLEDFDRAIQSIPDGSTGREIAERLIDDIDFIDTPIQFRDKGEIIEFLALKKKGQQVNKSGSQTVEVDGNKLKVNPGQTFLKDEPIVASSIKNSHDRPVKLRESLVPKFEAAMSELGEKAPTILEDIRPFGVQKSAFESGKKGLAPAEKSFHVKAQAFDIEQTNENKSIISEVKKIFEKYGFKQHPNEWWHFSFGEF